jgi:hypothetical protein
MKETLNLLPPEAKPGALKIIGTKSFYMLLIVVVCSGFIVALSLLNTGKIKKLDVEINALNERKAGLEKELGAFGEKPSLTADSEILSALRKAPPWDGILGELSLIVPDDTWLTLIESREEKGGIYMSIKGSSLAHLGVSKLISGLEASRYFSDVDIVFSQKGPKNIIFELKTKLRWT